LSIARFAHRFSTSPIPELRSFDPRVASFVFGKIAKLAHGTPVGTDLAERVGIASKHRELNIHRVFIR
jgi:hypothetical protein